MIIPTTIRGSQGFLLPTPTPPRFNNFNSGPGFTSNEGPFEYIYYYEYEYDDEFPDFQGTEAPPPNNNNNFNGPRFTASPTQSSQFRPEQSFRSNGQLPPKQQQQQQNSFRTEAPAPPSPAQSFRRPEQSIFSNPITEAPRQQRPPPQQVQKRPPPPPPQKQPKRPPAKQQQQQAPQRQQPQQSQQRPPSQKAQQRPSQQQQQQTPQRPAQQQQQDPPRRPPTETPRRVVTQPPVTQRPNPNQIETRLPSFSFFPVREQLSGAPAQNAPPPAATRPNQQQQVPSEQTDLVDNNRPRARGQRPEINVRERQPSQEQPSSPPRQQQQQSPRQQQQPREQPRAIQNGGGGGQRVNNEPFTAFRNFPQFPRTPAPERGRFEPPPTPQPPRTEASVPLPQQEQFLEQQQRPQQRPVQQIQQRPPQQQRPQQQQQQLPQRPPQQPQFVQQRPPQLQQQQQLPPQPQLQSIFGDGQTTNQFNLGPFTAFSNFQRPVQPLQPQQIQQQQQPGLGFDAVRNTVVHDSGSQSSSFFSFQRPEFNRPPQQQQPSTRFPEAQRPSPVSGGAIGQTPASTFFSGFPQIGSFVDTRGGQRAQRDLHEKEAEVQRQQRGGGGRGAGNGNKQNSQKYKFPDAEFGGFVPMRKNRRY